MVNVLVQNIIVELISCSNHAQVGMVHVYQMQKHVQVYIYFLIQHIFNVLMMGGRASQVVIVKEPIYEQNLPNQFHCSSMS